MTGTSGGIETSIYDAIGGEAGVRRLVGAFYRTMDTLPEAKACRDVHPPSLTGSEQKLFEYLSGWLGGPQLYTAKYGHPRLRQRHFAAPIGSQETEGWILCFKTALQETVGDAHLREAILQPVLKLAFHMQNKP